MRFRYCEQQPSPKQLKLTLLLWILRSTGRVGAKDFWQMGSALHMPRFESPPHWFRTVMATTSQHNHPLRTTILSNMHPFGKTSTRTTRVGMGGEGWGGPKNGPSPHGAIALGHWRAQRGQLE